ncbi:MAG: MMPL family transporter [Planctomycetota bacterium]
MHAIAEFFGRHRRWVGWGLLAMTCVSGLGYVLPSRVAHPLERYQRLADAADRATYSERVSNRLDLARSDAFLVVECEDFFRPESVRAIRRMVAAVEELPIVEGVFWADEVPMLNVFGFADPLVPADDASPEAFAESRDRLLGHPLARQLISEDGKSLLMPIVYDWLELDPEIDGQTSTAVLETAIAAVGTAGAEGVRVRLTGRVPLFRAQQSAFDRNQILFQSLGYFLALILAIIMFRGVAAVMVVSLAPAIGVFWSLGIVKLLGVPSNPLAEIVMPVLVSMIGLTDGVHLLVHIRRQRLAGLSPVDASKSAIEKVGLACWLTSLTTAIGFASLLLAGSDYVQDFGRACCVGVLAAFVAVVTFVPWVSSTWVGRYIQRGEERDILGSGVERLRLLIDLVLKRRAVVAVAAVVVTVALAAASLTLRPDNRLAAAMPASSEAYQALVHCDEELGGIEFFRVEMAWPESVSDDDPRLLATLADAEALINAEPLLSFPLSVRAMLASFPGDPTDLETQMTFLSLLPDELRGFFFDPTGRRAIISVRMQDRGIAYYKPVFEQLESDLADVAARYEGFTFTLAGQPVEIARDLYQIVDDLRISLGAASLIILIVLGLVYRSVRVGLISVVPNLLPLVVTGGWIALTGGTLDMSGVCAFVVCLGIAVDDTIHFLSRFHQELVGGEQAAGERSAGEPVGGFEGDRAQVHDAIRRAFVGVGAPLVMTTIILCTGFGTMLLSDLPGHRTFAAMACSTIAAAILGDMIALPPLLSCFFTRSKRPGGDASDKVDSAGNTGDSAGSTDDGVAAGSGATAGKLLEPTAAEF